MKSLWNDEEASLYQGELSQRVYSSRLLGREPALVLHGGGNTSVKLNEKNLLGEEEALLYVKGSGADLEHIEASGFAPVRLNPLLKLATLPALSDPEMVNALRTQMTRADAPRLRSRRSCTPSCRIDSWTIPTPMRCWPS